MFVLSHFGCREDMCNQSVADVHLPPDLAAYVAESNARFDAEIRAWDSTHAVGDAAASAATAASPEITDVLKLVVSREDAILSEASLKSGCRMFLVCYQIVAIFDADFHIFLRSFYV
jgi:hypothetical protein